MGLKLPFLFYLFIKMAILSLKTNKSNKLQRTCEKKKKKDQDKATTQQKRKEEPFPNTWGGSMPLFAALGIQQKWQMTNLQ